MRLFAIPCAIRLGCGILLAAAPAPTLAAPFCIQSQSLPPQCNYYDASECEKDAAKQGGYCNANPENARIVPNVGQYCMVTSGGATSCVYADRQSCMADAAREGGACTDAPELAPYRAPNPYSAINGL